MTLIARRGRCPRCGNDPQGIAEFRRALDVAYPKEVMPNSDDQLKALLEGLEAGPAFMTADPQALRELGKQIAAQAKEAVQPIPEGTQAERDVLAERQRQISVEGWSEDHDDEHAHGVLARAAASYALMAAACESEHPGIISWLSNEAMSVWPWDAKWWKSTDTRRNLIKAGALILAEVERLDRANEQPSAKADGEQE